MCALRRACLPVNTFVGGVVRLCHIDVMSLRERVGCMCTVGHMLAASARKGGAKRVVTHGCLSHRFFTPCPSERTPVAMVLTTCCYMAGKAGAYFGAFLGFTNLKQTEPREPFNPLSNDPEAAARLFDETEAIIAEAVQKHGLSGPPAQGQHALLPLRTSLCPQGVYTETAMQCKAVQH